MRGRRLRFRTRREQRAAGRVSRRSPTKGEEENQGIAGLRAVVGERELEADQGVAPCGSQAPAAIGANNWYVVKPTCPLFSI